MSCYDYDNDGHNGLPDPADAAQRLEDFVSWFGDGNVWDDRKRVCHSRDIAAVFTAYRQLAAAHKPSGALRDAAAYFVAVNVKLKPEDVAYVYDFLRVYADQLEGSNG